MLLHGLCQCHGSSDNHTCCSVQSTAMPPVQLLVHSPTVVSLCTGTNLRRCHSSKELLSDRFTSHDEPNNAHKAVLNLQSIKCLLAWLTSSQGLAYHRVLCTACSAQKLVVHDTLFPGTTVLHYTGVCTSTIMSHKHRCLKAIAPLSGNPLCALYSTPQDCNFSCAWVTQQVLVLAWSFNTSWSQKITCHRAASPKKE